MLHLPVRLRKNGFPISSNNRFDQKLFSYCAAASAAGVSLLALALPGEAEIVYTPANLTIPPGGSIELDVNHDGITDFTILDHFASSCGLSGLLCWYQLLTVSGPAPNGALRTYGRAGRHARGLARGSKVGPSLAQYFYSYNIMDKCKATRTSAYVSGTFQNGAAYVGLAFSINGKTHYGWARFNVVVKWRCHARIVMTGYAYETVPGMPIRAGEWKVFDPSSMDHPHATLGGLALGSVGLEAWRRDEVAVETPDKQ
jgi:hypothetical protein